MAPAFPQEEFEGRQERLRQELARQGVDVCLVISPENICYLTGHATPGYYTYQALVFPRDEEPTLLMRESEVINAEQESHLDDIRGHPDSVDPIAETGKVIEEKGGASSFGLEDRSWYLPPNIHRRLVDAVRPDVVVTIDDSLKQLRVRKSEREIEALRSAAKIVNRTVTKVCKSVEAGVRERDVAATVFDGLVRGGSEFLGMEPFVASGPRSGRIHASWSDRVIEENEPVLLEFAAAYHRYHAVLMHTAAVGELSKEMQYFFDACRRARDATIETMQPGNTAEDCHRACVRTIESHGLLEYYRKRTGYSVGLAFAPDWGEGGLLSLGFGEETILQPGMVIHAVPAIRKPGVGGIGLSATVSITESGPEILTYVE